MNKISYFCLILIFISGCSFHSAGGFWTKQKKLKNIENNFKSLIDDKEITTKEFNSKFNILVKKSDIKIDKFYNYNNNDGYTHFKSNLEKITKYNFSKIKDYSIFEPNLVFYKNNVIFFDNKGSILNFNNNSKLIWKVNNYLKDEKKYGPLITLSNFENKLIVADNFAKTYAMNIDTGEILWSKKNTTPFNSEIKFYKDYFFVIDTSNVLNCFSIKNGEKIWSYETEKSFVNSFKKLSLIIKDNIIVFNNSLGDITAVDINQGSLLWQISSLNSKIFEEIMSFKTSKLIENDNTVYFSNNKNKFFSIDLYSGAINWTQDIKSDSKPLVFGNFIFTISNNGYFFVIDKKRGNILRITDVFNKSKINKKMDVSPTGIISNYEEIFITTNNGRLILVDIKTGKINRILKIDNNKISRPFVKNQNMYLIRDNSIVKLN